MVEWEADPVAGNGVQLTSSVGHEPECSEGHGVEGRSRGVGSGEEGALGVGDAGEDTMAHKQKRSLNVSKDGLDRNK